MKRLSLLSIMCFVFVGSALGQERLDDRYTEENVPFNVAFHIEFNEGLKEMLEDGCDYERKRIGLELLKAFSHDDLLERSDEIDDLLSKDERKLLADYANECHGDMEKAYIHSQNTIKNIETKLISKGAHKEGNKIVRALPVVKATDTFYLSTLLEGKIKIKRMLKEAIIPETKNNFLIAKEVIHYNVATDLVNDYTIGFTSNSDGKVHTMSLHAAAEKMLPSACQIIKRNSLSESQKAQFESDLPKDVIYEQHENEQILKGMKRQSIEALRD